MIKLRARLFHVDGASRVVCSDLRLPIISCHRAKTTSCTPPTRDLSSPPHGHHQPPSSPNIGPIITFLSPSPQRSRSSVEFLNKLFHLPQIQINNASAPKPQTGRRSKDCLDELHFGKDSSSSWDSIACACPTSGTVLHFLSYHSAANERQSRSTDDIHSPLQLIAIHGPISSGHSEPNFNSSYQTAMIECRRRLAETMGVGHFISAHSFASTFEARLRGLLIYVMCSVMGRAPQPHWIIPASNSTIPIFDLAPLIPSHATSVPEESIKDEHQYKHTDCRGILREIVLPFFPAVSSLQSTLSQSSLSKPLPGLYQYPTGSEYGSNEFAEIGLIVRPLPAAQEDLRLSPPSLVFQCKSLATAQALVEEKLGGRTYKIGWRGNGQLGSLIVSHPSITGLDVRICETPGDDWVLSSSFDESQDSLLAGSLEELQSVHVVSEGKHTDSIEKSSTVGDETTVKTGDCWVELRTTMKHPSGFLKKFSSTASFQKPKQMTIAKPPDLPYE